MVVVEEDLEIMDLRKQVKLVDLAAAAVGEEMPEEQEIEKLELQRQHHRKEIMVLQPMEVVVDLPLVVEVVVLVMLEL
jgi:hypothetical protein